MSIYLCNKNKIYKANKFNNINKYINILFIKQIVKYTRLIYKHKKLFYETIMII
jgi:hypothetical protein